MYLIGAGTQKDLSKAFQWFLAAAGQNYSSAQSKVGLCYAEGYGVAQDYEKAKLWFSKAAAQGDSGARAWLENPDYPFLTKDRVVSLVEKYHLQNIYIVEGTPEFQKKYPKAKNAYASSADAEGPLMMEDTTIFGSAKEGLVLTKKSLFFNGVATGKGVYPISEINSVGLYSDSTLYQKYVVLKTAPHSSGEEGRPIILSSTFLENDARNLGSFWQDLLMLSVDD